MIGNSLVGLNQFSGEAVTLRHYVGESYSTATGKPTRTANDYPVTARVRAITQEDRSGMGTELVAAATEIAVVPAPQLPAGIAPTFRDQLLNATRLWEIVKVTTRRVHGLPVEYVCQVVGR